MISTFSAPKAVPPPFLFRGTATSILARTMVVWFVIKHTFANPAIAFNDEEMGFSTHPLRTWLDSKQTNIQQQLTFSADDSAYFSSSPRFRHFKDPFLRNRVPLPLPLDDCEIPADLQVQRVKGALLDVHVLRRYLAGDVQRCGAGGGRLLMLLRCFRDRRRWSGSSCRGGAGSGRCSRGRVGKSGVDDLGDDDRQRQVHAMRCRGSRRRFGRNSSVLAHRIVGRMSALAWQSYSTTWCSPAYAASWRNRIIPHGRSTKLISFLNQVVGVPHVFVLLRAQCDAAAQILFNVLLDEEHVGLLDGSDDRSN